MSRQPNAPGSPVESGTRLAAFTRPNRDKPDEELRICLDEFNSHPYISVRVWAQDWKSGEWRPTSRGCSVRISEASGVARALLEGVRLAESGQVERPAREFRRDDAHDRHGQGPRGRGRRPDPRQASLPEPAAGGEGFSEFD